MPCGQYMAIFKFVTLKLRTNKPHTNICTIFVQTFVLNTNILFKKESKRWMLYAAKDHSTVSGGGRSLYFPCLGCI